MPGKVIAAVMHKAAGEAEHVGWNLASCKIFFQAVLCIIHGHQGGAIPELITSATLCWDRIYKLFEEDRHFHNLHAPINLHPTMSEKVSSAVKFVKPKPAKVATDSGIPNLPTAPTAPMAPKRSLNAQNGGNPERSKTGERRKSGRAHSNGKPQLSSATGKKPLIWHVDKMIQQCSCCGSGGVSSTKFIQHTCHAHACFL